MSEIKGQILGIILAIGVFTCVFGALTAAFANTSSKIQGKMETAIDQTYQPEQVVPAAGGAAMHL